MDSRTSLVQPTSMPPPVSSGYPFKPAINPNFSTDTINTISTKTRSNLKPHTNKRQQRKTSYYSSFNETTTMKKSKGQYLNDVLHRSTVDSNEQFWKDLIPTAAYFKGYDPLFSEILTMIYENPLTSKLSSLTISKHGQTIVDSMSLQNDSKYYPAIKNLPKGCETDNVRKALAVSNLRTFANLEPRTKQLLFKNSRLSKFFDWDETIAGELASKMTLIQRQTPEQVGNYILSLGYTQSEKAINSYVVDVVYNNNSLSEEIIDQNNELAFLLGEQLDNLFDPLTEYSPEPTEKAYIPPTEDDTLDPIDDDLLVKSICNELVKVQTNFTVLLVQFLQKFLIPLRVHVLEGKIRNYTTTKLNQIFPPTIDEVTRINCIFLDMLQLAAPHGSFEVLKASGTTIPYFYKAHMRHEAATKNFQSQFEGFLMDLQENGYETEITYDKKTIESIIYSSLNLPKVQLILNRLMETKKWPLHLKDKVEQYYDSCVNTIIAFGSDKLKPYNHRIFTPTGKILTELASDWPAELQYGWLTRRVVAIFDVVDILSPSVKNNGAIIIFSDHILFLDIVDDPYYNDLFNKSRLNPSEIIHKPSIADILMHSLVNEVPFSSLPMMKVSKWSKIDVINAQFYNTHDSSYVQFLDEESIGVYKIDKFSGSYVIEIVNKAKILNKSQPFHLFKSTYEAKSIYYTAHESESYEMEEVKSPFAVFLNTKFDLELLGTYNLFGLICLSFTPDKENVVLQGVSRSIVKIEYVIPKNNLTVSLITQALEMLKDYLTYDNPQMSQILLSRNQELLSHALKFLDVSEGDKIQQLSSISRRVQASAKEERLKEDIKIMKSGSRGSSLDLLTENTNNRVSSTKITKASTVQTDKDPINKRQKKKGFFSRLFKKESKQKRKQPVTRPNSATNKRLSQLFLSGEKPVEKPINVTRPVSHYQTKSPMKKEQETKIGLLNIDHAEIGSVRARNVSGTDTADVTNASSSLFVTKSFAFPSSALGGLPHDDKAVQRDGQTEIVLEHSANTTEEAALSDVFTRNESMVDDIEFSDIEKLQPSTTGFSTENILPALDSPVGTIQQAVQKKAEVANSSVFIQKPVQKNIHYQPQQQEVPRPQPQNIESKSYVQQPSAIAMYMKKLRQARAFHEQQLKERGITSVEELPAPPLDYRGLMYSPSTVSRLNNLHKQLEKNNQSETTGGDNWVKFNSHTSSFRGGLTVNGNKSQLPNIPALNQLINGDDSNISSQPRGPAREFGTLAAPTVLSTESQSTGYSGSRVSRGRSVVAKKTELDGVQEEQSEPIVAEVAEVGHPTLAPPSITNGQLKPPSLAQFSPTSSLESNDKFYTPMEAPSATFHIEPHHSNEDLDEDIYDDDEFKDAAEDMFASINLTDDSFTFSLPDLTRDFDLSSSSNVATPKESNFDMDDKEPKEKTKFYTPREYPSSTFSLQPPVAVFPISDSTRSTDQQLHSKQIFDEYTDANIGDQTSLCSALADLKDTTAGEILMGIGLDGKTGQGNSRRLLSDSSLASVDVGGLLRDESYAYLGQFLAGDVTLNGNDGNVALKPRDSNIDNRNAKKKGYEDVDYDAMFASRMKDGSYGYLAGIIGSGKTEMDLNAIVRKNE